MIEKEIKLNVNKTEIKFLINTLKLSKAKKEFCIKQITYRFDTKDKNLAKKGVFLRTRTGEKNTFTVKQKINTNETNIKCRKEIEVDVGNNNNIITINEMLKILGYQDITIMEKYRMQWDIYNCKVVIDELSIGFYIEIEGDEDKIYKLIRDLKLENKEVIIDTYWGLFEKYKQLNNIKGNNIQFSSNYNSFLMSL